MKRFPKKSVLDTNVPVTANLANRHLADYDVSYDCIDNCIDAVLHIKENAGLVLDVGGEIFNEYKLHLSFKGEPGVGDAFLKWVHDNQWNCQKVDRVEIHQNGDTYDEFPTFSGLENFDRSDRKFVAVANAHPQKPSILQAVDSKWWGWKGALKKAGITVHFLCPDFVKRKYDKKFEK